MEERVMFHICHLASSREFLRTAAEDATSLLDSEDEDLVRKRETVARALRGAQEASDRLVRAYARGALSEEQFERLNAEERESIDALSNEIETVDRQLRDRKTREDVLESVREVLADFPSAWAGLNEDERREFLRDVLEDVTLSREGNFAVLSIKPRFLGQIKETLPHANSRYRMECTGPEALTPREMAYLKLIGEGIPSEEIQKRWEISPATIYTFTRSIKEKLETSDMVEAARAAQERIKEMEPFLPLKDRKSRPGPKRTGPLTPREKEVLCDWAGGVPAKQTAGRFGVKVVTVYVHRSELIKKLGTRDPAEAFERACERAWLDTAPKWRGESNA